MRTRRRRLLAPLDIGTTAEQDRRATIWIARFAVFLAATWYGLHNLVAAP